MHVKVAICVCVVVVVIMAIKLLVNALLLIIGVAAKLVVKI